MNTKRKAGQTCTGINSKTKVQKIPYRKSLAVKQLEQLANDEAANKFPTIPTEWLAPRKYRDDSANGLTKCIIDFLKLQKCWAERIANMGRQINNSHTFVDVVGRTRTVDSAKWIKGTGTNGTADVSAIIAGKSVKIEVKYGADRQSEAQKQYQRNIEQAGGIYFIASSFEQFYTWYNLKFASDGS